jgi:hypothetical protein
MWLKKKGQGQEQQQQQRKGQQEQDAPAGYHVTTGSLSKHTNISYESHINEFLAHFKITDIEPLKEYSHKLVKQMVVGSR